MAQPKAPASTAAPQRNFLRGLGRVTPTLVLLAAGGALLLGLGGAGPRAVDLIEAVPLAQAGSDGAWSTDAPNDLARGEIPSAYLTHYRRFASEMELDWRFLAAIGGQESDHGRNMNTDRVNRAGCVGPMQLGVGGECGDFVDAYGRDGNADGVIDPRNPADAVATAAYGLRVGKGAPLVGGTFDEHRRAACRYHGACRTVAVDYANEVMERAVRYGFPSG